MLLMIGMSAGVRMDALYAITYSEKKFPKKSSTMMNPLKVICSKRMYYIGL
ncbi:hypothetical protein OL548_20600 [Lysinibacillus sp. MHQ-1]|nr:hypothetical protein OL548_20600 [Lysinibacillus sp. MHQ-1]